MKLVVPNLSYLSSNSVSSFYSVRLQFFRCAIPLCLRRCFQLGVSRRNSSGPNLHSRSITSSFSNHLYNTSAQANTPTLPDTAVVCSGRGSYKSNCKGTYVPFPLLSTVPAYFSYSPMIFPYFPIAFLRYPRTWRVEAHILTGKKLCRQRQALAYPSLHVQQ